MSDLRTKVIHLAYQRPDLRKYLVPLVKQATDPVAQYREIMMDHGVDAQDLDAYLPQTISFNELNEHLREEALFFQFGFGLSWDDLVLESFEELEFESDPSEGIMVWQAVVLMPWEMVARMMIINTAGDEYTRLASDLANDQRFRVVVSENVDVDRSGWEEGGIIEYLMDKGHLEPEVFDDRRGPLGDIDYFVRERKGKFSADGLRLIFKGESYYP